jgi:hypothetical protein
LQSEGQKIDSRTGPKAYVGGTIPLRNGVIPPTRRERRNMNFHLQYVLTSDDVYEFQMAYIKHRKSMTTKARINLPSPLLILAAYFVVCILWMKAVSTFLSPAEPAAAPATSTASQPSLVESLATLILYFGVFFLTIGFGLWLRRSRALYRRYFVEMQKLSEPHVTELTDTQITIRQSGSVNAMEWSYFIRCIETKSEFLLFTMARFAHIVPKRAFASPDDITEFRKFVRTHIDNGTRPAPVQP